MKQPSLYRTDVLKSSIYRSRLDHLIILLIPTASSMYHFARTKELEGDVDKWDRWILHQEEEKQREKDGQKKKRTTSVTQKEPAG